MIDIKIQRKAYGDQVILGQVELEIAQGQNLALLGPSGIGKTTFLNIISGLDKSFEGSVQIDARIGMIFQEPTLLPWRSVEENITLMTGVDSKTAQNALAEFQLEGKGDLFPGQLSLGQQRRLSIARAFAVEPEFLIMDEPFTSLDEALAEEMIALTKKVIADRNVTSLLVTHSRKEAETLSDQVLLLSGKPAKLKRM